MLKVTQQIHDEINKFKMSSRKLEHPTHIYISCDLLSTLIKEVNISYIFFNGITEMSEEYLKHMPIIEMRYLGLKIIRILDTGHVIIQ